MKMDEYIITNILKMSAKQLDLSSIKQHVRRVLSSSPSFPSLSPSSSYDICDEIDWFVDLLGNTDHLLAIMRYYKVGRRNENQPDNTYVDKNDEDDKNNDPIECQVHPQSTRTASKPPGLHFTGAHWASALKGVRKESYGMKYQIDKTAHFCQTFAVMIHITRDKGVDFGFVEEDWANNIRIVLRFLTEMFQSVDYLLSDFLTQLFLSEYCVYKNKNKKIVSRDRMVPVLENGKIVSKNLSQFTHQDIFSFIDWVDANAESFINCKQG